MSQLTATQIIKRAPMGALIGALQDQAEMSRADERNIRSLAGKDSAAARARACRRAIALIEAGEPMTDAACMIVALNEACRILHIGAAQRTAAAVNWQESGI